MRVLATTLAVVLLLLVSTVLPGTMTPTEEQPVDTSTAAVPDADTPRSTLAEKQVFYPVVRVIDGDTLVVRKDGENVTIRLIGIDTPEVVDPRKTVQCFGREASEKANALLEGEFVRLESDPTQGEYDKYGRSLAYVFLPSGLNVAEHLIVEGYGHEYTYRFPYKYQENFKTAEDTARAEKRGLWAEGACEER